MGNGISLSVAYLIIRPSRSYIQSARRLVSVCTHLVCGVTMVTLRRLVCGSSGQHSITEGAGTSEQRHRELFFTWCSMFHYLLICIWNKWTTRTLSTTICYQRHVFIDSKSVWNLPAAAPLTGRSNGEFLGKCGYSTMWLALSWCRRKMPEVSTALIFTYALVTSKVI